MLADYYDFFKGTAAYNDATAMPVILENGRKVFGPPLKYNGPRPSHICELYITRIPSQLNELGFLVWLHRVGQVYAFRLMMDTGNTTRGYAFVRYCNEIDALAAFELLKYLYVDNERLSVFRSQGKNRLFVSGIPRQLPLSCLDNGFKLVFPNMQSCTAYPAVKNCAAYGRENEENRGFAFIEFEDHENALAAKKRLNTGRIRMWGVDLKIQWARPKEEMQAVFGAKKYPEDPLNLRYLDKPNDYCAKLRLYCLANNYCTPVILYGPSYRHLQLQYAGVLIKNNLTGFYCYILLEILVHKISDVHLLICEIAVKIIKDNNGELRSNTLIRVLNDSRAELVYTFEHCDELKHLQLLNQITVPNAIIELASSLHILGHQNHEKLLLFYKRSFLTHQPVSTFCLDANEPLTRYCAVLPKFRNNRKLNNNFNDLEIILLLMTPTPLQQSNGVDQKQLSDVIQWKNFNMPLQLQMQKHQQSYLIKKQAQYLTLKSQHASFGIKYILRYVDLMGVENRESYHPVQRVNSNPIWIAGRSYQESIYN